MMTAESEENQVGSKEPSREHWMQALPALVFLERAGRIVFANDAARHVLGLSPTEAIDRPASEMFWGLYPGAAEPLGQGVESEPQETFECRLLRSDNRFVPVHGSYRLLNRATREAMVVALPAPPQELPRSNFLEEVLSSAPEAVAITHGSRVLHVNPEFCRLFGYTPDEALGKNLDSLILPDTRRHEAEILRKAVDEQGRGAMETVRQAKNGELVDVSLLIAPMVLGGSRIGYYISLRDIRDRRRAETRLQQDALRDTLTGLANRTLFVDRLQLAIARRARRPEQSFAVMFVDLDRFQEINERLGHTAGDQVLEAVANRLKACFRPQDAVARIGGDEFAVLLENVNNAEDVRNIVLRAAEGLRGPMRIFDQDVIVTASIGVAFGSDEHVLPEEALRDADRAMYRAKQQGGNRFEVFDAGLMVRTHASDERERELRRALETREFDVWYQPVYHLEQGTLEGFEALLRWRRTDGSHTPFMELLPLAEETGLIITIGEQVLDQACRQLQAWLEKSPQLAVSMSVNISAGQLLQPDMVERLSSLLAETRVPPALLRLEVSESALNHRPEQMIEVLQRVVGTGARLALDNFGRGLASMNHLVRLPIDLVKLDRRLTSSLPNKGRQTVLVETLFDLGRALRVQMLAEGIETREQLEALRQQGCDLGQGHLFSSAVSPAQAEDLIDLGHWTALAELP